MAFDMNFFTSPFFLNLLKKKKEREQKNDMIKKKKTDVRGLLDPIAFFSFFFLQKLSKRDNKKKS